MEEGGQPHEDIPEILMSKVDTHRRAGSIFDLRRRRWSSVGWMVPRHGALDREPSGFVAAHCRKKPLAQLGLKPPLQRVGEKSGSRAYLNDAAHVARTNGDLQHGLAVADSRVEVHAVP